MLCTDDGTPRDLKNLNMPDSRRHVLWSAARAFANDQTMLTR
jgi:hypothetical protein